MTSCCDTMAKNRRDTIYTTYMTHGKRQEEAKNRSESKTQEPRGGASCARYVRREEQLMGSSGVKWGAKDGCEDKRYSGVRESRSVQCATEEGRKAIICYWAKRNSLLRSCTIALIGPMLVFVFSFRASAACSALIAA